MASKNIYYVKKAIFDVLKSDSELLTLLGGENIFYFRNSEDITYPSVAYSIITDTNFPFNENDNTGRITETTIQITIFSKESSSKQSDDIEARIKELLSGNGILTNDDIIDFGCRKLYTNQQFDQVVGAWATVSVYSLLTAPNEE